MEEKEKRKRATAAYSESVGKDIPIPHVDKQDVSLHADKDASLQLDAKDVILNMQDEHEEKEKGTDWEGEVEEKTEKVQEKVQTIIELEIESLQKELEETRQQSNEYFEGWQRERADFINYRKRIERDQILLTNNITGSIIKKYLVILDDLELALKTRSNQDEKTAWEDGIELIYRKLKTLLESEGVQSIPETNEFDPNLHEAISHEESPDYQSGQIIEIVQQGYMLGDRILRPARVRVAR